MSIRIAEEIINGRRLNREDDLAFFMEEDLDSLCRGADEIRRRLRGDRADLCSIITAHAAMRGLQILCPVIMPQCKDKRVSFSGTGGDS